MKNIGIIGYGEIGQSLEKCYLGKDFNVQIVDTGKDIDQLTTDVNILNICIPFTSQDTFIEIVVNYIKNYTPDLTIIHSTIIPGTTREIIKKIGPKLGPNVVHSPVRGIHPNLITQSSIMIS